ncbi:alpha/beta hydrolase-fold protein [Pseudomonas sp. CCC3.2]|uniref:alpha/beta hydrolase n=1 Tax=unclassified Pseudomonas TaxID=196821 RepID=UPI002AB5150A|nr:MULTISPECIES: alpha/beta hydrolase-fold protein [unclassified Pseudomonas]MDY7560835.1 alpha/beta hydrolase-fold protein [Pseudomonas sp. AB6]MEB0182028.1 alpha/beta hydrolase-fold protein [Pseudomonas sp. CCC3.2]MEB0213321.1 alpha/beta hydrolase-fold protein [Pseudomonas sp. AB6]
MYTAPRFNVLLVMLLGVFPLIAQAVSMHQPPAQSASEPTLADRGSAYYRFERLHLDSIDGKRRYRLELAIPRRAPPAAGYPVVYLLDGNNVMAELRDDWLSELDAGNPPLLVMVGYDIQGRYDMDLRTRDYTGTRSADFLKTLITQIKPLVEKQQSINHLQQMLWGHSFGGLFVLYALFEQQGAFQTWFAASPSLWYQPQTYAKGIGFAGVAQDSKQRVVIMRGSKEGRPPVASFDGGSLERRKAMAAVPADANQQVAEHLATLPGMTANYKEFEGLAHGHMFNAALYPALRMAAGLK